METFSGKIALRLVPVRRVLSGLNKKKMNNNYYYDDDDTKFVKLRLAVFSRGELTVRMNLLGTCIARDGPDSSYFGVLKA